MLRVILSILFIMLVGPPRIGLGHLAPKASVLPVYDGPRTKPLYHATLLRPIDTIVRYVRYRLQGLLLLVHVKTWLKASRETLLIDKKQ